ncbi:MAG: hypothetical protein ACI88C_002296 [Acidimicrobiales bacterium]|jgi:hypothetical protein
MQRIVVLESDRPQPARPDPLTHRRKLGTSCTYFVHSAAQLLRGLGVELLFQGVEVAITADDLLDR